MVGEKWVFWLGLWARWRGKVLHKDLICTPIRRGPPFARARRHGLRSMSGRYSYGIDNPPTLRRSSFPQRVVRPVGVPKCKTRSGAPRDPGRTGTPARNGCAVPKRGLNGAYRVSATHFYRLPRWSAEWRTTTPVPSSKEGTYGDRKKKLSGQRLLFLRKPKPE